MTVKGASLKAMLNYMARDTFKRALEWKQKNAQEPYCYWAKDEFISIRDKYNPAILGRHPEIDDIDDHTIVEFDLATRNLQLSRFCPRLKSSIKEMVESGYTSNDVDGLHWYILPDGENYKLICYEVTE